MCHLGGPETGHQFIGDAPEQEHAGGVQLLDAKVIEFLVHVVPTDVVVWALEKSIQRYQVE